MHTMLVFQYTHLLVVNCDVAFQLPVSVTLAVVRQQSDRSGIESCEQWNCVCVGVFDCRCVCVYVCVCVCV